MDNQRGDQDIHPPERKKRDVKSPMERELRKETDPQQRNRSTERKKGHRNRISSGAAFYLEMTPM